MAVDLAETCRRAFSAMRTHKKYGYDFIRDAAAFYRFSIEAAGFLGARPRCAAMAPKYERAPGSMSAIEICDMIYGRYFLIERADGLSYKSATDDFTS